MLTDYFESKILDKLGEMPTPSQKLLIKSIAQFILNENEDQVFIVTGYAGTGKTTIIAALINALEENKYKTMLLAPTGRAAKVLGNFSKRQAYTIHKKIYKQKSSKDGFGKFVLGKNLTSGTFFIVDEASMIGDKQNENSIFGSGNLMADLLEFVYSGKRCKLILVGDPAQLPPVEAINSFSLDGSFLSNMGFPVNKSCLTDVVRQTEFSGILVNATFIRDLITREKIEIPKFQLNNFPDIISISGSELINELQECYDKLGLENTMVITRSNKRANAYNAGIRKSILFREETIAPGDYLMVVKNNYFWLHAENEESDFIANGDIIQIVKINKHEERYGFHFINALIRLVDIDNREIEVKILLETLTIESAALSTEDNRKLFYTVYEDYNTIKPKKAGYDAVRSNPYFSALQVKFAYAITCHKSQGGQWKAVFIDQGYFTNEMFNIEYLRWLYTAFTRASEKLYLVNFNKEFLKP